MPIDEDYKQKIMHARLVFDDNLIMISDVFKGNRVINRRQCTFISDRY